MCGIHAWVSRYFTSTCPQVIHSSSDDCWLTRRGPDGVSTVTLNVGHWLLVDQPEPQRELMTTTLHLTASVLQMRPEWQPQPIALSAVAIGEKEEDDYCNRRSSSTAFLAWNGEIYEVDHHHGETKNNNGTDDSALFQGNDTLYIAKRLNNNLDWSTASRDEQREAVVQTLGSLTNAEYAICIVTEQSIFYARDSWGRRSLVIISNSREFQLASVATDSRDEWTEVPPGILYEYQIETGELHETPFHHLMESPTLPLPTSADAASDTLESLLDRAVERRLRDHTSCSILFSGGLDSTLVAALALRYCPKVSLLTVSFVDTADGVVGAEAADAITAKASYNELVQLFPQARISWNHGVIPYQAVEEAHDRLQELIHPKTTVMDWNIATALWFASSLTNDRLLLSGLGADELLGGYRRHKQASEVRRDQDRLWERNLGRDDRILSDHGTEVRFPYLDTHVITFCRSSQDFLLQQNKDTMTDKSILRKVAARLRLTTAAKASKRAIQFGSRVAHISDTKRFGSRRKATATAHVAKS